VEIRRISEGYRVTVRPTQAEARSDVLSLDLSAARWPPDADLLEKVRTDIKPDMRVRIEASRDALVHPWAAVVGDPWSKLSGRIAGQICLSSELAGLAQRRSKNVTFAGLRCAKDTDLGDLPAAASEVDSIGRLFDGWGAATTIPAHDADSGDLTAALETCDVVHAAIHASSDGLFLRDGLMRAQRLKNPALRCRLLVLSACDAGDVSLPEAFLWSVLRKGVNVIAATSG